MILRKGSRGKEVKQLQQFLHLKDDGIFGELTEEAVKDFQKEMNLTIDGIVGEKTWKCILGKTYTEPSRYINKIIVHCSATPEGKDFTVSDIRRWHLERGFSDVGYHYIIYRDGSVNEGRPISMIGAHCTNHNTNSIGVCYIGGVDNKNNPKDTRTPEQKKSLVALLNTLKKAYPLATIHGHNEFANKACPSFNANLEYKSIK